jgi:hypothetical protein
MVLSHSKNIQTQLICQLDLLHQIQQSLAWFDLLFRNGMRAHIRKRANAYFHTINSGCKGKAAEGVGALKLSS